MNFCECIARGEITRQEFLYLARLDRTVSFSKSLYQLYPTGTLWLLLLHILLYTFIFYLSINLSIFHLSISIYVSIFLSILLFCAICCSITLYFGGVGGGGVFLFFLHPLIIKMTENLKIYIYLFAFLLVNLGKYTSRYIAHVSIE